MPAKATAIFGYIKGIEIKADGNAYVIFDKTQSITADGSTYTIASQSVSAFLLYIGNVNTTSGNPSGAIVKATIAILEVARNTGELYYFTLNSTVYNSCNEIDGSCPVY